MSRRRLLSAGAGLGLTAAGPGLLTACSKAVTGKPRTKATGKDAQVILQTPNNVFFKQWIVGFDLACSALGLTPHVGYSNGDNATLISVLQSALSRGATYVNAPSPSDTAVDQVARLCSQNGAWFSGAFAQPAWKMVDADYETHYRVFAQSPDFLLTYELGKRLFKRLGGSGKVAHLKGIPGQGVTYVRAAGFQKAAKEFPGIRLIENYGYFNRVQTQPVFAAMLSAHPDIKGVVAASDDSSMGCIAELQSRGIDDVLCVSIDAVPEFLNWMQKGRYAFASGSILGTWLGAWLLVQSYDAAHGVAADPLERMLTYGTVIVEGAEAASAYQKLILDEASVRRLYDPARMSRHLHPNDWQPQNTLAVMVPDDPDGTWVPEAAMGYGKKPSGFAPSKAWTAAAANGGVAKKNADLAHRAAANDPLKSIRGLIGGNLT